MTFAVIKAGSGRALTAGDELVVDIRTAIRPSDFLDDARVLTSTHREGRSRTLRLDEALLSPELYAALSHQRTGCTIVVKVNVEGRQLPGLADTAQSVYMEVWVGASSPPSPDDPREVIAVREVAKEASPSHRLLSSLGNAVQQRNAYMTVVEPQDRALFEEIHARAVTPSLPHAQLVHTAPDAKLTYALSKDLHAKMVSALEDLESRA